MSTNAPIDVLDMACGNGTWVIALANELNNAEVTGIDLAEVSASETPANCSFKQGDIMDDLPFDDESFNLVQLRDCPHIRDRTQLYKECHRVLQDGLGILQLIEPAHFLPYEDSSNQHAFHIIDEINCKIYTPETVYSPTTFSLDPLDAYTFRSARDSNGAMWFKIVQSYIVLPVGEWGSDPAEQELGAKVAAYMRCHWQQLQQVALDRGILSTSQIEEATKAMEDALLAKKEIKYVYNCLFAFKRGSPEFE